MAPFNVEGVDVPAARWSGHHVIIKRSQTSTSETGPLQLLRRRRHPVRQSIAYRGTPIYRRGLRGACELWGRAPQRQASQLDDNKLERRRAKFSILVSWFC